jgi:hypothetical protein
MALHTIASGSSVSLPGALDPTCDARGRRSTRRARAVVAVVIALVAALTGAAQASATEPVFDSTYDARLGDILRATMTSSSGDYLALQALGDRANSGDLMATRILAQLERTRTEIGNAVPLRKVSLPMDGRQTYAFYTSANTYWQELGNDWNLTGWYLGGHIGTDHHCAVPGGDIPGEDFHELRSTTYGCYMEDHANYNDTTPIVDARSIFQNGLNANTKKFDAGCQYTSAPWVYHYSDCVGAYVTDHALWMRLQPVSNLEIYTSQTYAVWIPYQWWDPSWDPWSAPTSQSTSLTDGRAKIDDADNRELRAWLNHLLDPTHYREPLPIRQTFGNCSGADAGQLDDTNCQQVMR